MTEWNFRRQGALRKQFLLAVEIGQHGVQEACALRNAGLNRLPFLCGDEIWKRIENPWTIAALAIGIHVVGDAVLDDHAPRKFAGAPRGSCIVFEDSFD